MRNKQKLQNTGACNPVTLTIATRTSNTLTITNYSKSQANQTFHYTRWSSTCETSLQGPYPI